MEERIDKIISTNNPNASMAVKGYRLAELITSCENLVELQHLCSTMDRLVPLVYEQLKIREAIKQ